MANILLMGGDLLHGNLDLHGWVMSDVSFYPTELVQYALLEAVLGLQMSTAHVAAAMTYTLAVLLAVLVARGGTSGREALARTLITGGIMVAPSLSAGVYAVDLAVGHIGTSVPLLLGWLIMDRAGRRWWIPALLAVLLGWVQIADQITEITGIAPLFAVAGVRFCVQLGRRRPDWYDAALATAAVAAYALAAVVQALLRELGGYTLRPLPLRFRSPAELSAALPALWKVLDLFGADFGGQHPGVPLVLALLHLVSVVLVLAALARVALSWTARSRARSGPGGGAPLTDWVLAAGIAANVLLYLLTMASTEGAHEVAVVLPYSAALAGRMLAPPLLRWTRPARRAIRLRRTGALGFRALGFRELGLRGLGLRAAGTRAGRVALAGALVVGGYLAGLGWELTAPGSPPANQALAVWLEAHDLRSGLGPYWESSSITVDSGGRVQVRAVTGALLPYQWMTNLAWYDPARAQPDFLIRQQPTSSGLAALRRRFGPPAGDYAVDGFTVLVWHRNLLAVRNGDDGNG